MFKIPGYNSVMEFSKEVGLPYMSVVNAMKRGYCKYPRRQIDGVTKNPAYKCWENMISRCNNPNSTGYNLYGGRGISVCPEWLDFRNFIKDIGNRPGIDYSIERIDVNKGYYKENCKWATAKEQANNKRIPDVSSREIIFDNQNRAKCSITGRFIKGNW